MSTTNTVITTALVTFASLTSIIITYVCVKWNKTDDRGSRNSRPNAVSDLPSEHDIEMGTINHNSNTSHESLSEPRTTYDSNSLITQSSQLVSASSSVADSPISCSLSQVIFSQQSPDSEICNKMRVDSMLLNNNQSPTTCSQVSLISSPDTQSHNHDHYNMKKKSSWGCTPQ